jgi:ATP-dependent DNA ligase
MLARTGPLPELGNWAYEVKWDGFRAIVSTVDGLRVRSRRGRERELVRQASDR